MAHMSGQNPVFLNGFVVPISRWNGSWSSVLADVTTSGTRGDRYDAVRTACTWQIDLPADDDGFPEALGLGTGAKIGTIWFRKSLSVCDKLEFTTVESVDTVSDNGDVVRLVIRGKGGALSNNVAAPAQDLPLPLLV